jgi:hypothetical protein
VGILHHDVGEHSKVKDNRKCQKESSCKLQQASKICLDLNKVFNITSKWHKKLDRIIQLAHYNL